jgi:hypothetical protein
VKSTVPQVPYTPPAVTARRSIGPMLNGVFGASDPGFFSAHFEK